MILLIEIDASKHSYQKFRGAFVLSVGPFLGRKYL
jgi:hypothetical protein